MKKQVVFFFYFLFISISICIFWHQSSVVTAAELDHSMPQSIEEIDLIVVGRVIGLIDSKTSALTRKHLEAHRVRVKRTLKGIDVTNQLLHVRPNGLLLVDGQSYVFFLRKLNWDWFEIVSKELMEASEVNIAAVVKDVDRKGGEVSPKRKLWMKYADGLGKKVITEFFVTLYGYFEWINRLQIINFKEEMYEKRIGILPEDVIASVVSQVIQAEPGPIIDDADTVTFLWLNTKGEVHSKTFYVPNQPPATNLIKNIEMLTRKYGRTS